jgi:hypothetical protein
MFAARGSESAAVDSRGPLVDSVLTAGHPAPSLTRRLGPARRPLPTAASTPPPAWTWHPSPPPRSLPPPVEQYRGAGIIDPQYRRGLFVVDPDQPRRLQSLFPRPRDDDGHVLAVVQDPVVPPVIPVFLAWTAA